VRTVPTRARTAGWLGHARDSFTATFGEEIRNLAPDIFPAALVTSHGYIGL
jgi:hypothetical protein